MMSCGNICRCLLLICGLFLPTAALAQEPKIDLGLNKCMTIAAGYNNCRFDDSNVSQLAFSASIYGVYADVSFNVANNPTFRSKTPEDKAVSLFSVHTGYNIPLCKWFRITPVVGCVMYHKTLPAAQSFKVDYGFVCSFVVAEWLNLYANLERYHVGFGAGIRFDATDWGN